MRRTKRLISLNFPDQDGGLERERERSARATALVSELLDSPPTVILTPSCSAALQLAALASGIGPGDEVIVPAFTHPSTANGFLALGARVRVADVRCDTLNIDADAVVSMLGPTTRVVVAMHYGGVGADMAALARAAGSVGAIIVEDAAQGLFGRLEGVPLGRHGALGCISFHRTKNVSAISGGALVVNRADLIERAEIAADKGTNVAQFTSGSTTRYEWAGLGIDGRMGSPALATLLADLENADAIQVRRHQVWDRYHLELSEWAATTGCRLPVVPPGRDHPAHLFHLVLPTSHDRDRFVSHCRGLGVQAARHFVPLNDSRFGRQILDAGDRCPVASDLAERLVRLPLHHGLNDQDVDRVVKAVTSFAP